MPTLNNHLVFAPVGLIMKYNNIDDAVELANSLRYALGASVFGPSQEQCYQIAKRLECGMVAINDFGSFYVRFVNKCFVNLLMCCPQLKYALSSVVIFKISNPLFQLFSQDLPFGGIKGSGYGRFGKPMFSD